MIFRLPISRVFPVLVAVTAAFSALACASPGVVPDVAEGAGARGTKTGPVATARRSYFEGMEELVAGNNHQAVAIFSAVARSPRYVRHAALAKIRVGDAYFQDQRYEEAAQAYRSFVAQHGGDPNVPYARFRIASCYFHRIPDGVWFEPSDHERDQTSTRSATRELNGFLRAFPTSRFAAQAREMLTEVTSMLLAHQIYVADFYESREKPRAVAWRLDHAIKTFPEVAKTPEIVWRMAKAYDTAEEQADAARGYATYIESFPEGPQVAEAKRRLEAIRLAVNPPSADPPIKASD